MIDPLPEWARQTPNLESLHNLPDVPWGGYNGQGVPLPSLPDLAQFVGKFLEKFLEQVVMAVVGFFIPGISSFEQLKEWAENLGAQITSFIYTTAGINLASWDDFVASLADGKGIDLPLLKFGLDTLAGLFGGISMGDPMTPAERMEWAVTHLIEPLNLLLGPNSPLSAANLFGRLGLGQFGGGVPLNALTPSVANELEPFTALSVPSKDGWSFNATEDAAQLICDGSPKALYLKSGVIKVEEGQPLDTSIDVKYSGVTSGAGQMIRYVLETFTTDDGSGTATPVIVGAVTNPSGTAGPVTLGDSSWDIPVGVGSVRPVLVVDELVTAGTVFWLNTPELFKKLAGPLSGGLPAAIQDRIDDLQATWDKFKGSAGGTVDDIEGALDGAGQAIRDAIANALGHAGSGHTSANILTYLQSIPQTVVSGLGDLNTLTNQIRDILAGLIVTPINSTVAAIKDWFSGVVGKTQNLTSGGTLPPTSVTGVGGAANIAEAVEETWNKFWDGIFKTTGSTGKTTTDVQTAAESIADGVGTAQTQATAAQSSANSISEIISIPHIVPAWQGGLADDVSFPIAQIDGTVASTLSKLYLIPVTTQQDRAYTALKFGLTGTSMTNFYVGIYFMDPTTGDVTKILDCGDVKSSLTSTYNQQMITLPAALSATRGDTYFIGLLQVGGTAGSLHRWSNTTNFSTGLYPQFIGEEASGTHSSLPSSVTTANIIAGARVWAALGDLTPILAPGSAFYADGFNRANAAQLSTPWTSRYSAGVGNIGIYSNAFGPQSGAAPGTNVYTYNSKLATTSHEVQADCASFGYSGGPVGALVLRGGTGGCAYARVVKATSGGGVVVSIRTHTSYNLGFDFSSGTARATSATIAPGTTNYSGTLRFAALGNAYTVYANGTQVVQWVDSGGIFVYDGTFREVGIGAYNNSAGATIFDNWQAKDI